MGKITYYSSPYLILRYAEIIFCSINKSVEKLERIGINKDKQNNLTTKTTLQWLDEESKFPLLSASAMENTRAIIVHIVHFA